MANVSLVIGGRTHVVACRDGEEGHLLQLGRMLDGHWPTAQKAGGGNAERSMLFVALLLADALDEAERNPPMGGVGEQALIRLAERLESLADTLEQSAPNA